MIDWLSFVLIDKSSELRGPFDSSVVDKSSSSLALEEMLLVDLLFCSDKYRVDEELLFLGYLKVAVVPDGDAVCGSDDLRACE